VFRVRRVAVRKTVGIMISEWGNGREERNSVYFRVADDVDEVFVSALEGEEEEEDFDAQNQGIEGLLIKQKAEGNKHEITEFWKPRVMPRPSRPTPGFIIVQSRLK